MSAVTSAKIIDGKATAAALRARIRDDAALFTREHGVQPGLAVVLVGDDPASAIYVRNKEKAAEEVGFRGVTRLLPATATQAQVIETVRALNADAAIHGILVQMPLPPQIDAAQVVEAIHPDKDVDGLHVVNAGRLMAGLPGLVPCTPMGCLILLKNIRPDLSGLHAVVIGRSNLVGKPVAQLLLRENCTVTMCHSRTPNLAAVVRQADIVVSAVGRPGLVKGDWIRPGAIVIDVGITRDGGRIAGDVDFDSVAAVAAHITPVPGGVGPMTIACLLSNTLWAARRQRGAA